MLPIVQSHPIKTYRSYMEQKTYKNPPILEAVFEARFAGTTGFSEALLASFREAVSAHFPVHAKAKRNEVHVQIENEKENVNRQVFEFDQLSSEDGKYLLQIEQNRVSVHRLSPYTSWTEFAPILHAVLAAHAEYFAPKAVTRLGLRYINRIDSSDRFSDLFTMHFNLPANLDAQVLVSSSAFIVRANEAGDLYKILVGAADQNLRPESYLLDMDYFNDSSVPALKGINDWLENAHVSIENLFESLITSSLKARFDT